MMTHTTLKPRINISEAIDFGDFKFINIKQLGESYGNQMGCIRGIVTDIINKDKLIRPIDKEHEHNFEQHMIYLNVNDGTGNLAVQISPHTYDKYKNLIQRIDKKPIVCYGKFNQTGQKLYCELMQIPGETDDVFNFKEKLKNKKKIIISSTPAVSKNKKSYYRVKISDGKEGLCFRPPCKLYAGTEVNYMVNREPFINIKVVNN